MALEAVVVYPCLFVLLFVIIVGGVGVYRYQLVACQAREATRWAAVHAANWSADFQQPLTTSQQIQQAAVTPLTAGMDPSYLAVQVYFVDQGSGSVSAWDSSSRTPTSTLASGANVTNTVRVTVTYTWLPEMFLAGPFYLKSTSEQPISY